MRCEGISRSIISCRFIFFLHFRSIYLCIGIKKKGSSSLIIFYIYSVWNNKDAPNEWKYVLRRTFFFSADICIESSRGIYRNSFYTYIIRYAQISHLYHLTFSILELKYGNSQIPDFPDHRRKIDIIRAFIFFFHVFYILFQ